MQINSASVLEHTIGEIFGGCFLLVLGYLVSFLFGREEQLAGVTLKPGVWDCVKAALIALLSLLAVSSLAFLAYFSNSHNGFRSGFFCCGCLVSIPIWCITGVRKMFKLRFFLLRRQRFAQWELTAQRIILLEQQIAEQKAHLASVDAVYQAQREQVHLLVDNARTLAVEKEDAGVTKDVIDPILSSVNQSEANAQKKMKQYALNKQEITVSLAKHSLELEETKQQHQEIYKQIHFLKDTINSSF